jgi:tetratricopeptide (TPR) repeat protein
VVNKLDQPLQNRKGLDYVIDRIEWYIGLHRLLLKEEWEDDDKFNNTRSSVEKKICTLYRSLIEYQVTSVCTLFVDVKHAILNTLKEILGFVNWEAKLTEVKDLEAELDGDITKYLKAEASKALRNLVVSSSEQLGKLSNIDETMRNLYKAEEEKNKTKSSQRIQNRIARFDGTGYTNTFDKIADREGPTGDWLLKHHEYAKWKSSETGLLVIEANPGRGKSVLAKSVVMELKTENKIVCYFFFTGGSNHTRATTALRAVLYQLFDQRKDIAEAVGDVIEKRKEESFYDIGPLWEVFESATRHCRRRDIFCIFDALDECEPDDAKDLLRRLKEVSLHINALCTTRPKTHISFELESFRNPEGTQKPSFFNIQLEDDDERLRSLSSDIDTVIDQKFDAFAKKYRIKDSEDKENLIPVFKSYGKQRTYLWVELIFKYLYKAAAPPHPLEWLDIINKFPFEINQTYINFLEEVAVDNRRNARRMFAMLVAAHQSLDVQEMNMAVNISLLKRGSKERDSGYFKTWITKNCGFLVEVFDQKLYFTHQTAKDFLLDTTDPRLDWLRPFGIQACHLELAKSCISYLQYVSSSLAMKSSAFLPSQDFPPADSADIFDRYSFLRYSAIYGLLHVQKAEYVLENDQGLAKQLNELSVMLENQYQLTGKMDSLAIAIGIAELAVSATVDYGDLAAESKKTLGNQLGKRFDRIGALEDLERAVKFAGEAMEAASSDRPNQAGLLEDLGRQLVRRYKQTGAMDDLDRAIELAEEALKAASPNHPDQADYLNNLGNWLGRRFERTGAIDDLERAIWLIQEALYVALLIHRDQASISNDVENQRGRPFERTGAREHLDPTVEIIKVAVATILKSHSYQASYLKNLGNWLGKRFKRTGLLNDLESAVEVARIAVNATPLDHPDRDIHALREVTI